ncbi:MAG: 2OG-Fe dioxygenase family protein [Burkholderiaceae bacterium]|nr:2OG-Fe dioxygenase family protein [Burkholderiaceae bacterium]
MSADTLERELFAPALSLDDADPVAALRTRGFALIGADQLRAACGMTADDTQRLEPNWSDLPPDTHLRDRGGYRYRRHASYMLDLADGTVTRMPHRAHWQPTTYNALHGGIERWFEPVEPGLDGDPAWGAMLRHLGLLFAEAAAHDAPDLWFIEAHQFRIDTANGIGRPTPEGAHRDGVDYVAVILVHREHVRGGETRVFQVDSPLGVRFTLIEPWSALLMDDARVVHETTPIQPAGRNGWRDTLVLTFRRSGFQAPAGEQHSE